MTVSGMLENERCCLDGVVDLALMYLIFGKSEFDEKCFAICLKCVENSVLAMV